MTARYAMVALKDYQLSVNVESISFQIKKENVEMWYNLTRNYFENQNFTIFQERKLNRDLCSQSRVKQDISSEYSVINFQVSDRTLINTKNLLEIAKKIPDVERVYGIIFQIKGAKFSYNASRLELKNQI